MPTPRILPHIFRAYDIRGKALTELTPETCYDVGRAFGTVLWERYGSGNESYHPSVVVGRDARTHGPTLEREVVRGLMDAGCEVLCIGQTPSPVNYFTLNACGYDGSIQVTASHNPKEDNGLKLQLRQAHSFSGDDLTQLRERIERGNMRTAKGSERMIDAVTPYAEALTSLASGAGEGLTIVVDAGNGVAGPVYVDVLRRAGCSVVELYTQPDGTFPNHPADPSKWDTLIELQASVVREHAACGFAFDGDGDRLGLVDEQGAIVTADQTLLLLARDHLTRNPGAPIIFTVSNSGLLQSEVAKWGGKPVLSKVGHSFVEHAMREHGAMLGGEQSGHFFCGEDYYPFDDALAASLLLLKVLKSDSEARISDLVASLPRVYQMPEWRPHCPDERKADVISRVTQHFRLSHPVNTLDGVRIDFGRDAWAGIRQSNTSPCLSVCIEARSPEHLAEVQEEVMRHMQSYPELSAQ